MELGTIGLGRMGMNMAERLIRDGHRVVGTARTEKTVRDAEKHGGLGASSAEDPKLEQLEGYVEDSGEGRWTVMEAIDLDVPAPIVTLALQNRFRSRIGDDFFGDRLLAALRKQFGGHAVRKGE